MKKKITKVLSTGLALAMVLSMAAYGSGKPAGDTPAAASPSSSAATVIGTDTGKVAEVTDETVSAKDTLIWDSKAGASGIFHPTLQYSNYDREAVFLVYDRLLTKDIDDNYVESLYESYEINEDATVYTFNLKKDIKWYDGEVLTAKDVAFTYGTTCHPDFGKGYDEFSAAPLGTDTYHDGTTDHVEGIKVTDDRTVSFTFKAPYLDALVKFIDKPVLAKHIWGDTPMGKWGDATELLQNPVGTSLYKFMELVPDQYVKLVANPDYFKGEPLIKNFIFKVSNKDIYRAELVNGDIDVTEVRTWCPDGIQTFLDDNIPIVEQLDTNATYLAFDTTDPILSNVRIRQAIVYTMDRQAMVDGLVAGHGSPSSALIKPSLSVYPDTLNTYDYSIEKAQELLKEAGYEDTNDDGIVDKDGKNLALTLQYSIGSNGELVQAIQDFAKAAGIQVDLVSQDFSTVLATLKDSTAEFDMAIVGATYRANMGHGGSSSWMSRWDKDPKEVELLNVAAASKNTEETVINYGVWCEYDNEMTPQFVLYFYNQGYAYNPKLVNYVVTPDEQSYNVETWYFENQLTT